MDMRAQRFGVEVEMTGITRARAAEIAAEHFHSTNRYAGGFYDCYQASDAQNRIWKFVSDASIKAQTIKDGRKVAVGRNYSVEMVTPICRYEDIEVIQELLRKLREGGAFVNPSCGVHIHVDAAPFSPQQIRTLVNIVAAKEDMIYRALQVDGQREAHYCKKIEPWFLTEINEKKPRTMEELKEIWYQGDDRSGSHYDESRYHCLNLHSVFQKGTIEFRAFNGAIHAGKIKAYIQFCLAITAQALNQRYATPEKTVSTNEKYTFRVWLLRLGMIGDEFKTARLHLLNHLEGNIAWKDPEQAVRQRERMAAMRQNAEETPRQLAEQTRQPRRGSITMTDLGG